MTEEEWDSLLDQISEPLLQYSEGKFNEDSFKEEQKLHEDAKKALHLFADNFDHFWD